MGKIHRLDADSGEVLAEIDVPEPQLHGLDYARGGADLLLRSEWSGVSGGGMSPLAKSIGIFS